MESRKPTPGVIARLMGLDQSPSQQPVQKKQRVLSENYLQRVASIVVRQKSPACHPFSPGIEEGKECNNVFHVVETLKRKKHHGIPVEKRKTNSTFSGLKTPSTRVKCISDDKTPQNFLEDTRQPYSLLARKLNDLQDAPLQPGARQITVLKSHATDCRDSFMFRKSSRMSEQLHVNLLKQVDDCFTPYTSVEQGKNEFLGSQLEPNFGFCLPKARIVLEPNTRNVGNVGNARRCFSPLISYYRESCLGDGRYSGTFIPQNRNVCGEGKERKKVNNDTRRAMPRSRFSKHVTRKMGNRASGMPTATPRSHIISSDTLEGESELTIPSLPFLSDKKNQFGHSNKLYVPSEGKNQRHERWKTTKKFQNVSQVEMLHISDQESSGRNLESKPHECHLSTQAGPDCRIANCGTPLGISSWESKSRKLDSEPTDGLECRNSDSNHKKSFSSSCLESGNNHPVPAIYVFQEKLEEEDSYGETAANCKPSAQKNDRLKEALVTWKEQKNEETEILKADESQQLATANCMMSVKPNDSFTCAKYPSVQQEISNEFFKEESAFSHGSDEDRVLLMRLEEGYQPSPDSVLGPLFNEESSYRSDCSKSVNGSCLDGLQMEVELLSSDTSEIYPQGLCIMVSSDEDSGSGSVGDFEENEDLIKFFRVEEGRDYSYLVDVLTEAGFHSRYPHMGFDARYFKEGPISYSIFEALEKKYGDHVSWKRSERRLLFDRINSALMEVIHLSMGMPVWTKPVARRLCFGQDRQMIEEELWMSIMVSQKKEGSKDSTRLFGKDDRWLELGEDIGIIGREIETSLIDQLVEDVVGIESF